LSKKTNSLLLHQKLKKGGSIQEGGRFAAVVSNCPKETHSLLLLMPVAPKIKKGSRYSGRCSSQLSKRDPFFIIIDASCTKN
jgi:hypothetical protein